MNQAKKSQVLQNLLRERDEHLGRKTIMFGARIIAMFEPLELATNGRRLIAWNRKREKQSQIISECVAPRFIASFFLRLQYFLPLVAMQAAIDAMASSFN